MPFHGAGGSTLGLAGSVAAPAASNSTSELDPDNLQTTAGDLGCGKTKAQTPITWCGVMHPMPAGNLISESLSTAMEHSTSGGQPCRANAVNGSST
jgi:hypothetical protein